MLDQSQIRLDSRSALYCPEYLHKTIASNCFDLTDIKVDDPFVKALKDAGEEHEKKIYKFIKNLNLSVLQIKDLGSDESVQLETLNAMSRSDIDFLIGAYIGKYLELELLGKELSNKSSKPDLLARIGISNVGKPIWAPIDIKSHEAFDKSNKSNSVWQTKLPNLDINGSTEITGRLLVKDAMQLSHYLSHLSLIGFTDGNNLAGIIGKDGEFIHWSYLDRTSFGRGNSALSATQIYKRNFDKSLKIAQQALERSKNPTLPLVTIPRRKSGDFGCNLCEFQKICLKYMQDYDSGNGHVTLLSEVTASAAEENFPGIESINQLAKTTGLSPFGMKSVLRAKVWQDKNIKLINPSESLNLPEFDIEIDIDLENTQGIFMEMDLEDIPGVDSVYLYGHGVHKRFENPDWSTVEVGHFEDYENNKEGEYRLLSNMWRFLMEQIKTANLNGKTIGVFHYSQHEVTWWRNFAKRYAGYANVPTESEIETIIAKYFVDLYQYTRKIAFPCTGYSIKTLAKAANFEWEADDAGGSNSLIKYQNAISNNATSVEQEEARMWLRNYNRDDVLATFAVRNYIRQLNLG